MKTKIKKTKKFKICIFSLMAIILLFTLVACNELSFSEVVALYENKEYSVKTLPHTEILQFEKTCSLAEGSIKDGFVATKGEGLLPSHAKVYFCDNEKTIQTIVAFYKNSTSFDEQIKISNTFIAIGTPSATDLLN